MIACIYQAAIQRMPDADAVKETAGWLKSQALCIDNRIMEEIFYMSQNTHSVTISTVQDYIGPS